MKLRKIFGAAAFLGAVTAVCASGVQAASTTVYNDFQAANDKGEYYMSTTWNTQTMKSSENPSLIYSYKNGVFGRDEQDKSMYLSNDTNAAYSGDNSYTYPAVEFKMRNQPAVLAEGESQMVEMSVAWDGTECVKQVTAYMTTDRGSNRDYSGDSDTMLMISDGKLSVYGVPVEDFCFVPRKWYNLKILFMQGDNNAQNSEDKNRFTLWIDNVPVLENKVYKVSNRSNGTCFKGFYGFIVGQRLSDGMVDGKYQKCDMYVDDIKTTTYSAGEEVTVAEPQLFSVNAQADKYLSRKQGVVLYTEDMNAGIEDAKAGLTVGDWFNVRNAQGTTIDNDFCNASLEEVYIKYAVGHERMYTRFTDYNRVMSESFITRDSAGIDGWSEWCDKSEKSNAGGISARSDDDYARVYTTHNSEESAFESSVNYIRNEFLPLHSEVSFLVGDGNVPLNFSMYFTNGQAQCVMIAYPNGVVTDYEGNVLANAYKNEWNKAVISVYPEKQKYEIVLNGVMIAEGECMGNALSRPLKLSQTFEPGESGKFAVSKVKLTQGTKPQSAKDGDIEISSADESVLKIYNKGEIIFIPQKGISQDEFWSCVQFDEDLEPVVYSDGTYTAEAGDIITDGCVLVLKKNSIYKYYLIKTGEAKAVEITGVSAAENESGAAVVTLELYKNVAGNLFAAAYDENTLKEAGIIALDRTITTGDSDEYIKPVYSEYTINVDVSADAKIMFWDGNLTPIAECFSTK